MNDRKEKLSKLCELVTTFKANIKQYKGSLYNEANTRVDYIDKFFELLDWDVRNIQGFSEQYREVVREDKVIIKGKPKAPDYSFRIGGIRKFFVEAKRPSVNIKEEMEPAFQIRRYSYTAKLPLAILTDFEEFAVYDTRIKPNKNDKASNARIFYCTYEEYKKNFDFIYNTFSKTAILKGSFDRYIEENKNKKGTGEVDKEFLKLIEWWREILARNIALRNNKIDIYNLNYAVQKIIDRIIFLRIAEDRQMEEYGILYNLIKSKNIYSSLNEIFKKANDKYNSGLFKIEEWLVNLKIDDDKLKKVIKGLYYPDSPYEFSILPIEILGQIYEKFLGKIIRLTKFHQAKVEEKPEVRKAGGVYYTPQYIVDYIVKNTVGKKIKDKTPKTIENLRILDPACGSGSFLVGAYDYILKYHLEYYTKEKNKKKALKNGKIYQIDEITYKLTIEEKQKILLNNIYGVDIDAQAIEVTKLSLLLKLLEDENVESKGELFKHTDLKILPDLSNNIKCGNSLIGSDYFKDKNLSLFDNDDMRRINVFDWDKEFLDIFKDGGFDVVIGNPPYVRIQTLNSISSEVVKYYNYKYYNYVSGNYDIYILFLYKGYNLLKPKGKMGYILPHKFFQGDNGKKIRNYIAAEKSVSEIINFGTNQIFENATTYTCLFFLKKEPTDIFRYKYFKLGDDFHNLANIKFDYIDISQLKNAMWNFYSKEKSTIINKIKKAPYSFKDITIKIFKGSSTGNDKIYILKKIKEDGNKYICFSKFLNSKIIIEKDLLKLFLYGQDIRKYYIKISGYLLLFPYKIINDNAVLIDIEELKENYPLTYNYLNQCRKELTKRKIKMTNKDFYKYSAARSLAEYYKRKILIPDMLVKNRIGIDKNGIIFHGPAIHSVIFDRTKTSYDDLFYLGILNSNLFWFFIKNTSTALRGDAYRLTPEFLNPFKFPEITNMKKHDKIVALVSQMLEVQELFYNEERKEEKRMYKLKIELLDKQINNLVYKLYNLTDEEIKIVEENIDDKK